jgi:uncharacterized protein (DUF934 family)
VSGRVLIDGTLVEDPYLSHLGSDRPPGRGAIIVGVDQWRAYRGSLAGRARLGIRLRSDEPPELIVRDLEHFTMIALEFPAFRDGRAYSYARLLRERYGFAGELRAVGDVLRDQLHLMLRAGFNAFELRDADPLEAWRAAQKSFSVWYQPSGDGRRSARELRAAGFAKETVS